MKTLLLLLALPAAALHDLEDIRWAQWAKQKAAEHPVQGTAASLAPHFEGMARDVENACIAHGPSLFEGGWTEVVAVVKDRKGERLYNPPPALQSDLSFDKGALSLQSGVLGEKRPLLRGAPFMHTACGIKVSQSLSGAVVRTADCRPMGPNKKSGSNREMMGCRLTQWVGGFAGMTKEWDAVSYFVKNLP